jgi:hypothetical protein
MIRETWHEKLTILYCAKLKLSINQHQALKRTSGTFAKIKTLFNP